MNSAWRQVLEEAERDKAEAEALIAIARRKLGETAGGAVRPAAARRNGRVTVAALAEAILRERGGEMSIRDLFDAVRDQGGKISSTENLSKTLRRSDRFVRVGRGVWKLS